jgi:predicted membrane-bound spermidine synthase
MTLQHKYALFLFLLFFEGIIGTSYQVLYIRQFSSTVGMSAEITGIIIGVFLGAMSLGYRAGGMVKTSPLAALGKNFLLVVAFGGVTATPLVIEYYLGSDLISNTYLRIALYSVFSVGFVAYFIAQSIPLLIKFKAWGNDASEQGGNALFVSTLGSMVGSIIPSSIMAAYWGATNTLTIIGFCGWIVGTILRLKYRHKKTKKSEWGLIMIALLGAATPISTYLNGHLSGTPYVSTAYNDIYLKHDGNIDIMVANKAFMSLRFKNGNNAAQYVDYIQKQIAGLGTVDKDILILGAGGFQMHKDDDKNRYTYVDIDGDLLDWGQKYFGVNPDTINFVVSDARQFLIENNKQWDIIIMDTFASSSSIPEHLVTKEFFLLARKRIKKETGVFIANIIASGGFKDKYSQRMYNTIHYAMPFCQTQQVVPTLSEDLNNIIYTCFVGPDEQGVYSDDLRRPNVDLLSIK